MEKAIMQVAAQLAAIEFSHNKAALAGGATKTQDKIMSVYNSYVTLLRAQAEKSPQG